MQLSCLQENLSKGLAVVGRAVATRTTLPITQNILMATDGSRLRLSATNLEIAITTWLGAMVEEEGTITVPARLLTDFTSSLPAERIEVSATARPRALLLKCARFEARMNGTDAEEFPPIPTVQEGLAATIDPQVLRTAIGQVAFAAATEESRPVLTGVKVELEEDRFTFAAADGFRLAVHRGQLASAVSEPVDFIVPARTLQELNRLLAEQEEPVELMATPARSQVLFRLQNVEMVSQLIQGTFPNYQQLIPQSYTTRVVVDGQEFQRAARTAAIFARDGSGIVRLQATPGPEGTSGRLVVSSRAEELGEDQAEVDAKVEGEETKIAFNSKYLLDVLGVMERGEVVLETSSPSSPGVFRLPDSEVYVHVVMPMFVQW
ncbi:MAG: DNA polymerase III subunit beta [Dehalococcoidia bacterium]